MVGKEDDPTKGERGDAVDRRSNGIMDGDIVGFNVGEKFGVMDVAMLGIDENAALGENDGDKVGNWIGVTVGTFVGQVDGNKVGGRNGFMVGIEVGDVEGESVG